MRIIFLVSLLLVSFFASSQNVGSLPNSILPLDTASYTLLAQPAATTLRKASLNRIFLTGKNYYDLLYRPISYVPAFADITSKPDLNKFLDSAFQVRHWDDTTKVVMFDVSGVSTETTQTLTIPDASGTIARKEDLGGWLTGTLTGDVNISRSSGSNYLNWDIGVNYNTIQTGNSQGDAEFSISGNTVSLKAESSERVQLTTTRDISGYRTINKYFSRFNGSNYDHMAMTFGNDGGSFRRFALHFGSTASLTDPESVINIINPYFYVDGTKLSINGGINIAQPSAASSGHELLLRTNGSGAQALTKLGIGSGLSISGGDLIATGGGSGTVNSGNQYRLGYYASTGTAISEAAAITANRALISDANGVPTHSSVTATELGYSSGLTSSAQTQLNSKLNLAGDTYTTTTGNGLALTASTVTSGNLVSFTNTGTAAASNTKTALFVGSSGANGTSSQTTYAGRFSNTNTGTTSTNIAASFAASGATTNVGVDITVTPAAATFGLRTTGRTILGGGTNGETFFGSTSNSYILTPATNRTEFWSPGPSNQAISTWLFNTYANSSTTANHQNYFRITHNGFAPTSGTGTQNFLDLAWTINQTGGANGRVVGIKVEPTHTSTADFIAFDYNPVSGTPTADLSFRATQGNMLLPASSYINYGTTSGSTGRGHRDNAGVIEYKNSGGAWTPLGQVNHNATSDGKSKFFTANWGSGSVSNSGTVNADLNIFLDDAGADSQDRSVIVDFYVTLTKSDGSDATTAKYISAFKNDGGTITQLGTETEIMKVGNATPTFDITMGTSYPRVTINDNGSGGWNYRVWATVARQ